MAESWPPNSIFICYRRDDSADVAGRIYDRLVSEFGKEVIYRDVDTIPFGEDFREHIQACLSTCRVGLVVIGPDWCTITGRSGRQRLHEPTDHVRLEVEAMLSRQDMKTIPLFVRGAESPSPEALPEALQPLAFKNGAEIRRDPDFHHDVGRVLAQLRRLENPPTANVAPSREPANPAPAENVEAPLVPPRHTGPRRDETPPAVRNDERPAGVSGGAKSSTPPAEKAQPGWWRRFHAVEWTVFALAVVQPILWRHGSLNSEGVYDFGYMSLWLLGIGGVFAVWAILSRRLDAAAVGIILILAQQDISSYISSGGLGGFVWWNAVLGAVGSIILWRSPRGAGPQPRIWWRESLDGAKRTHQGAAWIAVLVLLGLTSAEYWAYILYYHIKLGLWLVTAILASLPVRTNLSWTVRFLVFSQAAFLVFDELQRVGKVQLIPVANIGVAILGAVLLVFGQWPNRKSVVGQPPS